MEPANPVIRSAVQLPIVGPLLQFREDDRRTLPLAVLSRLQLLGIGLDLRHDRRTSRG
jgi:hypothetical protein